ncbi:hypothetical protein BDN67DRAFT_878520, partial [Paxillus ammoniavirescens]
RVRKKARVRASGFEQEDDEPIENNPPPPSSSMLGLYDDPEGGEDIHNDLLLHTEPVSDSSDLEALPQKGPQASSAPMTIPTPPSYEPPPNPLQVYQDAHTTWFGRLLIVMVAILHTKHCVSFRACALILQCFSVVLLTLCMLEPTSPIPMTLNTIINHLDLGDRFVVYPVCIYCHRIYPTDTLVNALCSECDNRLFKLVSNRVFRMVTGCKPQPPPPTCATPIQLPSSLLTDFLASADNENACETWKVHMTKPGELHDISDGEVWKTAWGPDQQPFFSKADSSNELRIGVTMSLDWFCLQSSCSSYCAENLLVGFMTPGPQEPTGSQLQNYLKFIIDDLLKLYEDGVMYHTP